MAELNDAEPFRDLPAMDVHPNRLHRSESYWSINSRRRELWLRKCGDAANGKDGAKYWLIFYIAAMPARHFVAPLSTDIGVRAPVPSVNRVRVRNDLI